MHKYKGYWSFCPMSEMTTYTVEAHTEEEAVEMLIAWAYQHRSIVDEPCDFHLEQLA